MYEKNFIKFINLFDNIKMCNQVVNSDFFLNDVLNLLSIGASIKLHIIPKNLDTLNKFIIEVRNRRAASLLCLETDSNYFICTTFETPNLLRNNCDLLEFCELINSITLDKVIHYYSTPILFYDTSQCFLGKFIIFVPKN